MVGLWKERNSRNFEGIAKSPHWLYMKVIALAISWARCLLSFRFVSAFSSWEGWREVCFSRERRHKIVQRWEPPPPGMVKLNFDGACFGNLGPAGVGGLCRNDHGEVEWAYSGPIGSFDASEAEVRAVFYGIKGLKGEMLDKTIVEGDSLNVIRWLKGGVPPPWRFSSIFDEIDDLISGSSIVFKHGRRSANGEADSLARRGVRCLDLEWFDYLPP
ncbi:uncharacterized protein LOC143850421 [Tasmannia lanceolata]|uniref:uncharacterized protein LOC143850421 n=1 Tax=Tasmannia lanceolata TaxID=3420 RepID=UPI0040649ABF